MRALDKYLSVETQRKLGFIVIGIAALSHVWFMKPIFGFLQNNVIGYIDVGTIIGATAAYTVWLIYKRQL